MNEDNKLYYNREKLYSEVWEKTISELCEQYGISHAAFVKACETLNVPRPPVGYWTQKELGKALPSPVLPSFDNPPLVLIHPPEKEKKVKPPPSPKKVIQEKKVELDVKKIKNEQAAEILIEQSKEKSVAQSTAQLSVQASQINIKLNVSKWLEQIPPKDCVLPEAFEEAIKIIEKEACPDMAIIVPQQIEKEHPYVKNTRLELEKKIKNKSVNSTDRCLYKCYGKDIFDVEISENSIQRVLNILQSLCNAFEKRGFNLISEWNEKNSSGHIYVEIMGEKTTFLVTESLTKIKLEEKDKYGFCKYNYNPTGLLTLKNLSPPEDMKCPHWCNDKHKSFLEDKLNNFLIGLIIASAWIKENAAKRKKREDEWKREEELRREKERNEKQNKQRIVNFKKASEYWMQYRDMSAFLSMVKKEYRKSAKKNVETKNWINWASNYLKLLKTMYEDLVKYNVEEYNEYKEKTSNFSTSYYSTQEPYNYWKRPWYERH